MILGLVWAAMGCFRGIFSGKTGCFSSYRDNGRTTAHSLNVFGYTRLLLGPCNYTVDMKGNTLSAVNKLEALAMTHILSVPVSCAVSSAP